MVGVAEQVLGGPAEVVGDGVVLSNSFEVDLSRNKTKEKNRESVTNSSKMIDHLKWFLRMLQ
jgi:hypothetical protein